MSQPSVVVNSASNKLFRRRLSDFERALSCSRFTPIFALIYETVKILLAIALFIHVWQLRRQQDGDEATTYNDGPVVKFLVPRSSIIDTKHLGTSTKTTTARIFCFCSTTGPRHEERARFVRETWGRRCDKLLFASDVDDPFLPAKAFYNTTGREFVSFKMFAAWQWVYDNILNDYDWFLKGDDDTFVVMENVRQFLRGFNSEDAYYFGRPMVNVKSKYHQHYVSGSAQIFSRETIRRLIEEAYPDTKLCPGPRRKANEDAFIGYCLHNIGIESPETRDEKNRNRFLIFSSWTHLHIGSASSTNWVWRYDTTYVEGDDCCSPDAVSLHYMPGGKMLAMDYLIYRMRPFGASNSVVLVPSFFSNTAPDSNAGA